MHELFHKLGLGHSDSRASVMFWNQGARPVRDTRTYAAEVRAIVDAYR
ncbi:matrixin family metalloprotease [Sphingomonas sp.]